MATAAQAHSGEAGPQPSVVGQPPGEHRPTLAKRLGNWVVFLAALAALVVGVWLLWDVWRGKPVAAAFTRVGGATRVETAVDASRFWLTPPQRVVMTPAGASQQIMLGAARCAMVDDAPLLFTSSNPTRQRLVNVTIDRWQQAAKDSARREVILNQRAVTRCLANANLADVNELPMLGVPNQPFQFSRVAALLPLVYPACATQPPLVALPVRNGLPPVEVSPSCARPPRLLASPSRARPPPLVALPDGGRLAPTVVFAVAKAPTDPPDVAIGLALAAHMAMTQRQVSLLVVPRYLEADPKLEDQLLQQRQVVEGGIVLGSANVLPSDTRDLLRQLLTSTDQQGVLGEIRTNLGSVGPLIAALLALLGLGTAARKAPEIGRQAAGIVDRIVVLPTRAEREAEAERKAREEAERKAREEAERKAREEAERKAREEAERKAREEAERKAREEAERKAREEAERKAREEAERKAQAENQAAKRVYDQAHIEAESVLAICQKFQGSTDPAFQIRALIIKEQRSELVKQHLWVLWTDHFKPEHFQKYPQLSELLNEATKLAGAAGSKNSTDVETARELLTKIEQICTILWQPRRRSVVRRWRRGG